MESYWTRDGTHVLCIGRWILNHWSTREVLNYTSILKEKFLTERVKNNNNGTVDIKKNHVGMTEGRIYVREKKGSLDLSWIGVRGWGHFGECTIPWREDTLVSI